MKNINAVFCKINGDPKKIGKKKAELLKKEKPEYLKWLIKKRPVLSKKKFMNMTSLLDEFCPGLNNEIQGFSEHMNIDPIRLNFYSWSYLIPGCSHISLLPSSTKNNQTLVLRNYELSEKFDDMIIFHTENSDKYSHIGFSALLFGRTEGMNQHGLTVTMSSCGIPVGNAKGMNKPGIEGLQFWVIVRSLLEQCKNIDEAIQLIDNMPFAYNINLIITDTNCESVLIETYNGKKIKKRINNNSKEKFLAATNHILFEEFSHFEKKMNNSKIRLDFLNKSIIKQKKNIDIEFLKSLVQKKYPDGLTCHNYIDFFGTIRSMIFDLEKKSIELTIGSPIYSNWYSFNFDNNIENKSLEGKIIYEKYSKDFWELV